MRQNKKDIGKNNFVRLRRSTVVKGQLCSFDNNKSRTKKTNIILKTVDGRQYSLLHENPNSINRWLDREIIVSVEGIIDFYDKSIKVKSVNEHSSLSPTLKVNSQGNINLKNNNRYEDWSMAPLVSNWKAIP